MERTLRMKNFLPVLLFLFLVIGIGYCQDQPLELTIKSDKETYDAGEKIVLEAAFKNKSEKNMILFWSRGIPSVVKTVNEGVGDVIVATSVTLFPEVKKIYLEPSATVTKVINISTLNWEGLVYKIKLKYIYPNIDLNLKLQPNEQVFDGSVTSDAITIKVINNEKFTQ